MESNCTYGCEECTICKEKPNCTCFLGHQKENLSMVRETSSYHHITKSDLREGYVLVLSSGIILKYVGDVDILNKGNLLFKVIYSTFATVVWIGMTTRELEQKEVILLRN